MEDKNHLTLELAATPEMPILEPVSTEIGPVGSGNELKGLLQAKRPDDSNLSDEEKASVVDFSSKIDLSNSTQIMQYGNGAQTKLSRFSENVLNNIKTKDMDEAGAMITDLVEELKGFSPDTTKKKGFMGLFQNAKNQVSQLKTRYDSVEKNINKICDALEAHKIVLLKDIAMLDEMFEMNAAYFKELTMYILAGRQKLDQVITEDLPVLEAKAKASGNLEDAQAVKDLVDMAYRFDKKLHDLDLTRTISLQMGPQIRLVQNNDSIMVEKIQSSIVNTIPLWKNQMVLALGLAHSKSALESQREVTNMTNELLKKNADTLKTSTVEVAKESERSIVDIESLVHANEALISTFDEVMRIQGEGREKRRSAEVELIRIEDEIKNKLLEARNS